ncbi:MAG TPA: tetratricopeptide repeat protein [Candidatus Angelobacter sp.]|nr:tetratricopeptide repeat protein [Candidatus Angelobacter sp.]
MALGFGFNKAKIVSSAERYVQQGKLQNAIAEYEKVIKEDPKDLTILNTIGDLCVRIGQNDQACQYFRKVGDQYAQSGFTVKAIAIYKKLTRLNPSATDSLVKLAELYTQQGLFNDARQQYTQLADHLLKSGDTSQAAKILQRILELDPENITMQARLADLYIKLGKKDDAQKIYFSAAESLYSRKSYASADESLVHVLKLDSTHSGAILLRGMIASDSGNTKAAVEYLEQVPDIDSRPDALRALLRARLQTGNVEGVEAVAIKLLSVHNDPSGVDTLAQWYLGNNYIESGLKLYDKYADRFLSGNSSALSDSLYPVINRIRDNVSALTLLLRLLQKAGETSHVTEVMELLAHSYVQTERFADARDLYKELSELEPENPLHNQNYKQMMSRMGEDSLSRPLSMEAGQQAVMVDELEHTAPEILENYESSVERAIEAALTDAELFVSYNVPSKAIAPLEDALPLAPRDVRLNQRLATLYYRAERYADAARVCEVLSSVYNEHEHDKEAEKYAQAASNYQSRATGRPAPAKPVPAAPVAPAPRPATTSPTPAFIPELEAPAAPQAEATIHEFTFEPPEQPAAPPEPMVPFSAQVEEAILPPPPPQPKQAREIDLSGEWEEMLAAGSATHDLAVHETATSEGPVHAAELAEPEAVPAPPDTEAINDKVQEVRFYISQQMWDEARSGILDLAEMAPNSDEVSELMRLVTSGQPRAAVEEPAEILTAEVTAEEPEPPAAVFEIPVAEPEPPPQIAAPVSPKPQPVIPQPVKAAPVQIEPPVPAKPAVPMEPVLPEPVFHPPVAKTEPVFKAEPVIKAEPVLPAEPPRAAVAPPAKAPQPKPPVIPVPEPKFEPAKTYAISEPEDILELPLDDLLPAPPAVAQPAPPAPMPQAAAPVPEPAAPPPPPVAPPPVVKAAKETAAPKAATEDILGDFVLDLENSLEDFTAILPSEPQRAPEPVLETAPVAASSNGEIQDTEAATVLNDILLALQEDEPEFAAENEDPETHYNLGIAFKEMGLLDEAIGELQKVCRAVERGIGFSQPVQAYTWLAQCLVDKGVPEAAVRWYQQALHLQGLDNDSRCSIYYDLAAAYEAFGDNKSALSNFMEVYSSNIDFRDVASRIKTLKS